MSPLNLPNYFSRCRFVARNQLQLPLQVQLSAVIFDKAMRRKDSKDAKSEDKDGPQEAKETVNLVGIDSTRVSEFATSQNQFLVFLGKLAISFVFLNRLIG